MINKKINKILPLVSLASEAAAGAAEAGAADPTLFKNVFKSTELKYFEKNSG